MKPPEQVELEAHLRELRLPSVLREYAKTAKDAARGGLSHEVYLLRLCAFEVTDREARTFAKRIREARLPSRKMLADFEFAAMPSLEPMQVHRLASCEFVDRAENVLLVGNPGTGKTHLAISLGFRVSA